MAEGFFQVHERLVNKRATAVTAAAPVGNGAPPLTVTALTAMIDRAIKTGVPSAVSVQGEVSNVNLHRASGHLYFTLKDAGACVDCVMFKDGASKLKFALADGQELIVGGQVKVFAQRGRYQLYATRIQPVGQGALELAFQQVKAKLEAEGLFAPDRKRPIPSYPTSIALLTSRSTAALQDMLKVLRRFPWLRLRVYHVPVQGDGSAERIAAALEHLNLRHASVGGVDVILLARGGGSLEDLWEFNEEVVARAVAASAIPVVTGIGHEVDCSIADLVADHHAHTPTEAAQVVTAMWKAAADLLDASALRLRRGTRTTLQHARHRLAGIERHEVFRRPTDRVNAYRQLLDDRGQTLALRMAHRLRLHHRRILDLEQRLDHHRPATLLAKLRDRLGKIDVRLRTAMQSRLRAATATLESHAADLRERHPRHLLTLNRERTESLARQLDRTLRGEHRRLSQRVTDLDARLQAVSTEHVLNRGFSITTNKKTGAVIRSKDEVKAGERLVTRVADGDFESTATDRKQPSLFE